ncbi:MAG: hypothetical protein RBS02_09760 [Steroidobacteraceae bacterium]|nr:hypothetical protein [Steroidobacteraceae bacterium]
MRSGSGIADGQIALVGASSCGRRLAARPPATRFFPPVIHDSPAALNFFLQRNVYGVFPLFYKVLLLSCIARKKSQMGCEVTSAPRGGGGFMIGIGIVFLVSTIVLMTLSTMEG